MLGVWRRRQESPSAIRILTWYRSRSSRLADTACSAGIGPKLREASGNAEGVAFVRDRNEAEEQLSSQVGGRCEPDFVDHD